MLHRELSYSEMKNAEVFIPFSAYAALNQFTARFVAVPFNFFLLLFKISRALLYKGLIVPLIPRSVPVRLKKFL